MKQQELMIYENISKIKVNNAMDSISRKDDNYRLAQEIYEQLYDLKQTDRQGYSKLLDTLHIKDVDDLIDFKEKFIEQLPSMVVPNDYERTVLNVVELVKSEKMYYAANKAKTKTDDSFNKQVDVLEFMLLCQKNIKFEYIGAAIGFAISGNMNNEFNKIKESSGNVSGVSLWSALKSCNQRVSVDFSKIDKQNIDDAVNFKEQTETLRGANIIDGWFFDEKTRTIHPVFCSSSESLESQDCQFFEKVAILKLFSEKHGFNLSPIYLTNSYFNEYFNGDVMNENQQHATEFLNSFNPKLSQKDKNILNQSIFLSVLGNIKIPNDIHHSLNFSDILMCNMFAVGSDTEHLAQKFMFFNSLPSPQKESEFFNFNIIKINEMLDILGKTNGLNTKNDVTITMLNNIDLMIAGLDNFNLSNMPENVCFHLTYEQMEQMEKISKKLSVISKKTVGYSKTKLSINKRIAHFGNLDKIENYYSEFYEETGEFFDYSTNKVAEKDVIVAKKFFETTRNNILKDIDLMKSLATIAQENIFDEYITKEKFVKVMVDIIAVKQAFPETPISSLSKINVNIYQNIKTWEKNTNNSSDIRTKYLIVDYILNESNHKSISSVINGLLNNEFKNTRPSI